jgi:hypothetical protein
VIPRMAVDLTQAGRQPVADVHPAEELLTLYPPQVRARDVPGGPRRPFAGVGEQGVDIAGELILGERGDRGAICRLRVVAVRARGRSHRGRRR